MIPYSRDMSALNSKSKFVISVAGVFAIVGVTYLAVALFKNYHPDPGVRNSTDEFGNRVLLARAEFVDDELDGDWTSEESAPIFLNKKAYFGEDGQNIVSPNLYNSFTKYVEFAISGISEGEDAAFNISGFDHDDNLLETITIESISEIKTYGHRFSYDHVFIDRIAITYLGQEAVAVVDYVSIYALQ